MSADPSTERLMTEGHLRSQGFARQVRRMFALFSTADVRESQRRWGIPKSSHTSLILKVEHLSKQVDGTKKLMYLEEVGLVRQDHARQQPRPATSRDGREIYKSKENEQ